MILAHVARLKHDHGLRPEFLADTDSSSFLRSGVIRRGGGRATKFEPIENELVNCMVDFESRIFFGTSPEAYKITIR